MAALAIKEMNNDLFALCPNCSYMYRREERGVPVELPARCRRCRGPMDADKAREFAEEQAQVERVAPLSDMGDQMRSMGRPQRSTMMRRSNTKTTQDLDD